MRVSNNSVFPLVFIGPMGAGKTRVGRRVARALEMPFIDTDKRIAAAYGPIREIFEREGEDYFRVMEREAVVEALAEVAVVSLGGGAVMHKETRADLTQSTVVFLSVSAAAVKNRIGGRKRPLLRDDPGDWQRIYDERRPIYEALANIRFDTSNRKADNIAEDIVTWLREKL